MQTTTTAICVTDLRKSYGSVQAVAGVSFSVSSGEIVALLGPNGAGKTTTLEILEGFRARDGGSAEVLGVDPGDRRAIRDLRERVGLVLQDIAVEPYLTVRETIARQAGYYRSPRPLGDVIDVTGLTGLERRKVKQLSGGQKRRLDIALGLIGDPELLYLDEPTTGFDPAARQGAWQLVRELRAAGTTILLTTHDMAEAQALADRVVLLNRGAVVAQGPPDTLRQGDANRTVISFRLPEGQRVPELPLGASESYGQVRITTCDPVADLHQLTGWALAHRIELAALTVARPSLEAAYLELTRDAPRVSAPVRSTR